DSRMAPRPRSRRVSSPRAIRSSSPRPRPRRRPAPAGRCRASFSREAGSPMPRALIDLEGVSRTYHLGDVDVHALAGVHLRVEQGELLALMGASGSRKSTLMNILGCLDRPTCVRYLFEGVDHADLADPELTVILRQR